MLSFHISLGTFVDDRFSFSNYNCWRACEVKPTRAISRPLQEATNEATLAKLGKKSGWNVEDIEKNVTRNTRGKAKSQKRYRKRSKIFSWIFCWSSCLSNRLSDCLRDKYKLTCSHFYAPFGTEALSTCWMLNAIASDGKSNDKSKNDPPKEWHCRRTMDGRLSLKKTCANDASNYPQHATNTFSIVRNQAITQRKYY